MFLTTATRHCGRTVFVLICLVSSFPAAAQSVALAVQQTAAQNQTPEVDLSAIAAAAYGYSPSLRQARAQLRQVQELYPQALANYQPQVNANAGITDERLDESNFGGNLDGATTKDVGVTLEQPIYRGGRSAAQKGEAEARIDAQTAAVDAASQRTAADAMTAAIAAAAAQQSLRIESATEQLYDRLVSDTKKRSDGGEATATDRALVESRKAGVTAGRLAAQSQLQQADRSLATLTGRPGGAWQLTGEAAPTLLLPPVPLPDSVDEAVAAARAQNPDRYFLNAMTTANDHGIDLVSGELLPQLRFLASWLREWDPSPGLIDEATSRQVGLRLTIPLYEGGGTRSRVRQAKNRKAESQYALQDFDAQLEQDVRDAWTRREIAAERVRVLTAQAATAEVARNNTEREISAGERTVTDLIQADQIWLDAQLQGVSARQDEQSATIELLRLLGRLRPQDLGFQGEDPARYLAQVKHRVLSTSLPD